MNKQIILPLLKVALLIGSPLVFGGEPVDLISEVTPQLSESTSREEIQSPGVWELAQSVAIFLFVICLLFGCSWLLKRWRPGLAPGNSGLMVKSALPLGGRDRIIVVQAGDRQLLLGVSPGKITLLGDYDQLLPEPEASTSSAKRFRDLLKP